MWLVEKIQRDIKEFEYISIKLFVVFVFVFIKRKMFRKQVVVKRLELLIRLEN